ncbi:rmlC-like jelly roll fold protein [Artemisia annua]|uniref:RmlC-like jelly roll fold protein n=1 Tax=Artemisia annua TaxID=35608 RepID=A0A2U1NA53_ARTAN|nr:rmlC-like jelly roll fold protein [Artemisia annua]
MAASPPCLRDATRDGKHVKESRTGRRQGKQKMTILEKPIEYRGAQFVLEFNHNPITAPNFTNHLLNHNSVTAPQFYEPQSPPFFYTQQPLPQLPTQFDPFEPRYTQQKRRERVSEPLPIRDDTDDDEDFDHFDMVGIKESGCNDLQVFERANGDFEKQFRKAFAHSKAWYILKDQPKWKEQPLISQIQESTGSSKKRKSSESSSAQTPTNVEDFNCHLSKLNDEPAPSRQSRGKKRRILKIQAEFRCVIPLQAQLEVQKKKDTEYFKFIAMEVYNRDMKFVMEPHDNNPDPAFKEFVISRKREICTQHCWPCSL